jgi:hypothetical protein
MLRRVTEVTVGNVRIVWNQPGLNLELVGINLEKLEKPRSEALSNSILRILLYYASSNN